MLSIEMGVNRLLEGLQRAGVSPVTAPASAEELAAVRAKLPLSPEMVAWYSYAAPKTDIIYEWGAVDLTLHSLPKLVDWQVGYRWHGWHPDQYLQGWPPEWVVIANWHGDAAIAHTDLPGTPVSKAHHGAGEWKPFLIAPTLSHFLQAVGIWAEIVHGEYQGDIEDDEYEMRQEVRRDLDDALAPVLEKEYRQHWIQFD